MSTDKKTYGRYSRVSRRFQQLAALGEVVFHASDLATLWNIINRNTLYTTLKRYVQQGLLYRIQHGMYAIKPVNKVDPLLLGIKALHTYAYVSCETILFSEGILNQSPSGITLISSVSRRFVLAGKEYSCRKMADIFLYQSEGISENNGVRVATPERAVADLLYYNAHVYFDAPVNWKEVRRIQKAVGYPFTPERYQ